MNQIPFSHPVDSSVRQQIHAELQKIEEQHAVTILYACESGSRGWGFASPDSDYDVRFIYVGQPEQYLTVEPVRDVIEVPISKELDISGWDLRKALHLLKKSNPTLLEWLNSPIVYREDGRYMLKFRELTESFYSPIAAYHHYVSMAKTNFREHLKGETVRYKKYLYVIRPLLAAKWIREGKGTPPMRLVDLVVGLDLDPTFIADLAALLEIKMRAGEGTSSPRWPTLHAFIEREIEVAQQHQPSAVVRGVSSLLDAFLFDSVCGFNEA